MSAERDITTAVMRMAGTFKADTVTMYIGLVESVDENAGTCSVRGQNDVLIPDVMLQAAVCDGLLIVPVVGSTVMVVTSTNNDPFVALYSDVDKLYLQVGSSSALYTNDGKQKYNDGTYGGWIKSVDPNDPTKGLLKKINQLEQALNGLINYVGGLPIPVTGAVSAAPLPDNVQGFLITPITQRSDIESDYITHGKPD